MAENSSETRIPPVCETPGRPWILGENPEDKEAIVFKPPCGLWSCPVCSETNAQKWVLDAFRGTSILTAAGFPMSFVTVTARGGAGRTRERSIEAFRSAWPKLRKRVKYHAGEFEYILIPEQHKNGVVHFHLLATNTLSQRHWKDYAYQSGLGYMAKVKPVEDAGRGAYYVSKYLGKEFVNVQWPKGYRRARASKGWPRLTNEMPPDLWNYAPYRNRGKLFWELAMLEDDGYNIRISESAELDRA